MFSAASIKDLPNVGAAEELSRLAIGAAGRGLFVGRTGSRLCEEDIDKFWNIKRRMGPVFESLLTEVLLIEFVGRDLDGPSFGPSSE